MRPLWILWIEDTDSWLASVQANLHLIAKRYEKELKIHVRLNGEDLGDYLPVYPYDVILMDFNMSPFNGDKYIKDIRYLDHLDHIPIIFYSQDTSTDLQVLVNNITNVSVVYRPNLEDHLIEHFIRKY
jgi:DNA-binding response OmpR family regulator